MGGKWQSSVGDLSEMLRPAFFVICALASAWVLFDARRRKLNPRATAAWTLLVFLLPPVVLPLYLIARMYARRDDLPETATELTDGAAEKQAQSSGDTVVAGSAGIPARIERAARKEDAPNSRSSGRETFIRAARSMRVGMPALPAVVLPLVYATVVLLLGALYFYLDYGSFDAHFARARQARLYKQRERAIREYVAALRRRDDAHTHKLLGLELAEAERWEEALAEFRAASRGGEPDERLPFSEAVALDRLNRPSEAADAYRRFLGSRLCAPPEPDPLCGDAQARLSPQPAAR